jgi:hypothetical protein
VLRAGVESRMVPVAILPPADALIVAEPAATPVTSPLDETVATAVFDDAHGRCVRACGEREGDPRGRYGGGAEEDGSGAHQGLSFCCQYL